MQKQKLSEMVMHVRQILERNMNSAELDVVSDLSTLSLSDLIEGMLAQAISQCVLNAPAGYIEKPDVVEATQDVPESGTDYAIRNTTTSLVEGIKSPGRILKIFALIGSDWDVELNTVTSKTNILWRMAEDKYIKTVGVHERPVAAWGFSSGDQAIFIQPSCKSLTLQYVAMPEILTVEEYQTKLLLGLRLTTTKHVVTTTNDGVEVSHVTTTVADNTLTAEQLAAVDETEKAKWDGTTKYNSSTYYVIPCDPLIYEASCWWAAYLVALAQNMSNANLYLNEAMKALQMDKQITATQPVQQQ